MKKRITAIALSVSLLFSAGLFSSLGSPAGDELDAISTLSEAISAIENASEDAYSTEAWAQLQAALAEAKTLSRSEGYFAVKAGVAAGHMNENRYITAAGGHYDSYATLRYRGKGETADSNPEFTADQIWEKTGVEGRPGVFTLKNKATGVPLFTGSANSGGYIVACGGAPASAERTYFEIRSDGSGVMLYAADQAGIVNYAVNFTKKTHHVPDTNPPPRADNFFRLNVRSSITEQSYVIFERLDSYNTELDAAVAALIAQIKTLLRERIPPTIDEIATLRDAIAFIGTVEQSAYTPDTWLSLQAALAEAKALGRTEGYFAVKAGVAAEHMNENRYITAAGGHWDSYATLRYRGKGETADSKPEFTADQVWEKIAVEGRPGVFTLKNKATGSPLFAGGANGNGYIVACSGTPATVERTYFEIRAVDGVNSMLYVVNQTGLTDQAVDFTKKTHNVPDTSSPPRTDNFFLTRPRSAITGQSYVIFERLDSYNAELDAAVAALIGHIKTLLRDHLPDTADGLTTLEQAVAFAKNAKQSDYEASAWALLQSVTEDAALLIPQEGQFAIRAGVAAGHMNENRYITAAGGHWDSYATLRYRGKGEGPASRPAFTNDQIWEKVRVEGRPGVFTLKNRATGQPLFVGSASGAGYVVACTGTPVSAERTYFELRGDGSGQMLYAVNQAGIVNHAVNFTKKTHNVPDNAPLPRLDNFFLTNERSTITGQSHAVFERLNNDFNNALDKAKEDAFLYLVGLLRRAKDTPLSGLALLYADIMENDCAYHYTAADYAELQEQLILADAILRGNIFRIVRNGNAIYADADGYAKFDNLDQDNANRMWLRIPQENGFFQLANGAAGTYLYHSDEQNPIFSGIADFGYYIRHGKKSAADLPTRLLFRYDTGGNLQPVYNSSAMADAVSIMFKKTGGQSKLYADAGLTSAKRVEFLLANRDAVYSAATASYDALHTLRGRRDGDLPTFDAPGIEALVRQAEILLENDAALYAQGTVEELENAVAAAKALLEQIEQAEPVTQGQQDYAGNRVQKAIGSLKVKNAAADAEYRRMLEDMIAELTAEKDRKDKNEQNVYHAPCIAAAAGRLAAARAVLAKPQATYGEVDGEISALLETRAKLVEEAVYLSLLGAVENIRNRSEQDYQPKTWNAIRGVFEESARAADHITQYTNQEVLALIDELTRATAGLQKKANFTVLQAIVSLVTNLQLKENSFTAETWKPFRQTFEAARAMLLDLDAQQASVDSLAYELPIVTGSLKYKDGNAQVGLFPDVNIGYPKNVVDRYKEGFGLGTKWGAYAGYGEAYDKGYAEGFGHGKADPKRDQKTEYVYDDPENITFTPVQEVREITTKTVETIYERGGRPLWALILLIAAVPVLPACGVLAGYLARKKSRKKSGASA